MAKRLVPSMEAESKLCADDSEGSIQSKRRWIQSYYSGSVGVKVKKGGSQGVKIGRKD